MSPGIENSCLCSRCSVVWHSKIIPCHQNQVFSECLLCGLCVPPVLTGPQSSCQSAGQVQCSHWLSAMTAYDYCSVLVCKFTFGVLVNRLAPPFPGPGVAVKGHQSGLNCLLGVAESCFGGVPPGVGRLLGQVP